MLSCFQFLVTLRVLFTHVASAVCTPPLGKHYKLCQPGDLIVIQGFGRGCFSSVIQSIIPSFPNISLKTTTATN